MTIYTHRITGIAKIESDRIEIKEDGYLSCQTPNLYLLLSKNQYSFTFEEAKIKHLKLLVEKKESLQKSILKINKKIQELENLQPF